MHSPLPSQENHVSSLGIGARAEAVIAAPGGVANDCPVQKASISLPSALESQAEQCPDSVTLSEVTTKNEVATCETKGVPGVETAAVVLEQEPVAPLKSIDEVADMQSTRDAVTISAPVSIEDCTSGVARDGIPPRKRIERVCAGWIGEDTVLTVSPNEFVLVWADSTTEQGWIFAEHLFDTSRVGWLPTFVFEDLPQHQVWMKAMGAIEAVHETQLKVKQGSVFKVSINTRTEEGWAYAETACDGEDHSPDGAGTAQTGWVPVFCLAWTEE